MKEIVSKALNMASDMGVKDLDIIYSTSDIFSLKAEKGELSEYKKANSHSLGFRVIENDKVGTSYTEAIDEDSLKQTIEFARKNASYSKTNPHEKIASENVKVSDHNPKANVEHSPESSQMIEKTLMLESEVLKRDKRATGAPYNGLTESKVSALIMNSRGSVCEYSAKSYSTYTSALLNDGDKNSMHYQYDMKRDFRDLDYDKCINESIEVASNLIDAGQISTGTYNVLYTPDLLNDLLGSFMIMLSAKAAIDKTNPWKDELGNMVASDKLNLVDDPYFAQGYSVIPFDSEGFKKQKNTFIENGILKQFMHNSATASELGMENNFCASRSAKSSLGTTLSNTLIAAGSDNEDTLNTGEYVEIIKAQGLHSGVRPISGDFSLGVSGRVWKDGEIASYFKDVTINGNFYEMLKNISFVGNKIYNSSDMMFFTPKIIFNDLSIAGK